MIVSSLRDPLLRASLVRAARPDEDVVWDDELRADALARGFPRVIVHGAEGGGRPGEGRDVDGHRIPTLTLTRTELDRWESSRRRREIPPSRVEFNAIRLRGHLTRLVTRPTWVDRSLADLGRAVGAPLPPAFKGLARRVLEFPSRYVDLWSVSDTAGLSRGALKARFRRRGLDSPYSYLRWLRVLCAAHVLSDSSATILETAERLGFSSGGNFCRAVETTCGLTPNEIRRSRERLLVTFAGLLLDPESRRGWEDLDELFLREVG